MVKSCVLIASVAWYPHKQGYELLGCICLWPCPAFISSEAGHPARAAWCVWVSAVGAESSSTPALLFCWHLSSPPNGAERLQHGVPGDGRACALPRWVGKDICILLCSFPMLWAEILPGTSPAPCPWWLWDLSGVARREEVAGPSCRTQVWCSACCWWRMQSPRVFLLLSSALCCVCTPGGKLDIGVHTYRAVQSSEPSAHPAASTSEMLPSALGQSLTGLWEAGGTTCLSPCPSLFITALRKCYGFPISA